MRSPEEVFRDIEEDRAVREGEIRLVENHARKTSSDREREMLLRVSVLLTYAHLEGFCKFALNAYVSAVNSTRLPCREVSYAVVAATLTTLFRALRNPDSKHPAFARLFPDDSKLHLAFRERAFIAGFDELAETRVLMPDTVIDSESNLSSAVLKKNLFRIGLEYHAVDEWKADIDKLLGVRNAIAHGAALKAPQQREVEKYVASAVLVMQFVQSEVFTALKNGTYLRQVPPSASDGAPPIP
jgi:hypothetical protein